MATTDTRLGAETVVASERTGSRTRAWIMTLDTLAIGSAIGGVTALRDPGADGFLAAAVLVAAYAGHLVHARLYRARFVTTRSDELRRLLDAGLRSVATVVLVAFVADLQVDRAWLGGVALSGIVALALGREIVRRRLVAQRRSGRLVRRVLVIGDNHESETLEAMFTDEPELGYLAVGTVDPSLARDPNELTTLVLAAARRERAFGVVVAATAIDMRSSNRLIRDLVEAGIHVELSSTLADIASDRLTVRPLGRFPVVYVEPRHRHGWRAAAKRLFDLGISAAMLAALSPAMSVIALLIKRGSPGPVFFRQERVGKDGEPFHVLKFRTMVTNAEELLAELAADNEGAGPLFKMKDDPRVTRVGAFLRKTSLDELPQLWNVVRNEMSLVGPRPALRSEMTEWDHDLYGRLRVKPGITGMWQVSGRSQTTFEEYTRLDLYYVDNWSLIVDLAILAKTVPAVLTSDGAY